MARPHDRGGATGVQSFVVGEAVGSACAGARSERGRGGHGGRAGHGAASTAWLCVRGLVAVALVFLVAVVVTSPAVVYGEAQPLELGTLSTSSNPPGSGARHGGRIYYLSVVHERRAPWDVVADLVGRSDASAPRVAASPGPESSSGDDLSRQAATDAWRTAQRDVLGDVQSLTPPLWPAVGHLHGDSAGLAYLLRYLDVLLPGDVTGGTDVAATGVIANGGTIEPIGGLEEKLAAARSAGVRVAFVPALNDLDAVPNASGAVPVFDAAVARAGLWAWQPAVVTTAPYATAGARARGTTGTAVVAVSVPADALAWLCGYTGRAAPCQAAAVLIAHEAS